MSINKTPTHIEVGKHKITYDELLETYGTERLYLIAEKLKSIVNEENQKKLKSMISHL